VQLSAERVELNNKSWDTMKMKCGKNTIWKSGDFPFTFVELRSTMQAKVNRVWLVEIKTVIFIFFNYLHITQI